VRKAVSVVSFALIVATAPAFAQDGKTIFGENKKATLKAMKMVAKSLGVKCLHCHVKEGGKILYPKDTPEKEVARSMKTGFVDSLAHQGQIELTLVEDKKKTELTARYVAKGDSAGIYLAGKTADGKVHQKRLPLPPEGQAISCATCHNGKLHFLTHTH
jgi:cytochrome c553